MKREYKIIIIVCVLMAVLFQHDQVLRSSERAVVHSEYSLVANIEDAFAEEQAEGNAVVKEASDASNQPREITRKNPISISAQNGAHEFTIKNPLDKQGGERNELIQGITDKSVIVSEVAHGSKDSTGESAKADGDGTTPSPALELPVLSTEKILPVKFKILKQNGRVNIVDIDGNIYLDINSLARYYGKKVDWDSENEQFICKLFGVEIRGSSLHYEIFVNGNSVVLDQPVYMINSITYLPADSFAEEFGAEVSYEDQLLEFKVRNIAKAAFKLFRS